MNNKLDSQESGVRSMANATPRYQEFRRKKLKNREWNFSPVPCSLFPSI
ncbi:MAG: hypothetical protein PT118_01355 [Aphanizomenon gracile PMC644.10]|nr:hypothetical protein [Aphanizomenon gracile PMC644.10]